MPVPSNLKTPGIYTDVNINTQRTGLPANTHKVLFLTPDLSDTDYTLPIDLYDKAQADETFGGGSVMGRMVSAAIKTNRTVNIQGLSIAGGE